MARAGDLIKAESDRDPKLKPYYAAYLSLVNRVPEAIALSQEILAVEKNNIFVLNNLAFVLALTEGRQNDALTPIRKAIELVGPQPMLLDTEAVALIAVGQYNDAIEKLKDVIVEVPSATFYMHLAQAYQAQVMRTPPKTPSPTPRNTICAWKNSTPSSGIGFARCSDSTRRRKNPEF